MPDHPIVVEMSPARSVPLPPRRFQNETSRLLGLVEQHREANDNAVACFGRLAQYRFRELSSRADYDPTMPSIVSIVQPQAGGALLHDRMLRFGYQEFSWTFPSRVCRSTCYASDEALELFLSGGCTCQTHARPQPNILAALDRAGVDRIWVHLRNPAESAVSSYDDHLSGPRRRVARRNSQRLGQTPDVTKSAFVMEQIDWYVEWVAEWLRFARERPGSVVFSFHDELTAPQDMFSRVFSELGVEAGIAMPADLAPDRCTSETTDRWRHELTAAAKIAVETRMRIRLQDFLIFDRLWS